MNPNIGNRITKLSECIVRGQDVLKNMVESNILTPENLVLDIEKVADKVSQLANDVERQRRVAEQNKTVVLYGKFSTGKTTLINALLSSQAEKFPDLPVRDDPTTAHPVRLTYAEELESDEILGRIV